MIIGTGIDILELARLASALDRHPDTLPVRIFTDSEREVAAKQRVPLPFYGGRWAGKEAVVKALGVGIGHQCGWLDIEILNDACGRPTVRLSGIGAETAARLGVDTLHLSISHECHYACAMVVAERHP